MYCVVAEKLGLRKPSREELRGQWGKKIPEIVVGLFGESQRDQVYGVLSEVTTGHTSRNDFLTAGVPEIQILDSVANVPKALGFDTP